MLTLLQSLGVRMLLVVAAALSGYAIGRAEGQDSAAMSCAHSQLQGAQQQTVAVAVHDTADAVRSASIEREHLQALSNLDAHERVVTREVVRYVDSHRSDAVCGLDADGLRLWTSANAGDVDSSAAGAAGGAGAAVPAAAAAGESDAR